MAELADLAEAATRKHNADIYFYSGAIDDDGFGQLAQEVTTCYNPDHEVGILVLITDGGSANAGYQIARLFQKMYKEFGFSVPADARVPAL